ncbi:MAG: GNAT family N-acetyltransferase [Candidatus Korobacteraceae bacterium]
MLEIRAAQAEDVGTILKLIRGLAEYEHEPHAVEATEQDLLRDGFGDHPRFHCALAEWNGEPVGFALYFYNYSTWKGRQGIFLDDLFVNPEHRGKGIGKALLLHVARIAAAQNCGRYEWLVLDWNTPAIEFYESLGGKRMKQWLPVRVEGQALQQLAKKT